MQKKQKGQNSLMQRATNRAFGKNNSTKKAKSRGSFRENMGVGTTRWGQKKVKGKKTGKSYTALVNRDNNSVAYVQRGRASTKSLVKNMRKTNAREYRGNLRSNSQNYYKQRRKKATRQSFMGSTAKSQLKEYLRNR